MNSPLHELTAHARVAQPAWAALALDARCTAIERLGQHILAHHQDIARIMAEETGRSTLECTLSEIVSLPGAIKAHCKAAKQALKPRKIPISSLEYPGKSACVELLPRGVVGIIAPWNYPLANFWKHLFPALLAGNAVILKPSEYTPKTAVWLAEACQKTLPENLVQCLEGDGSAGQALLEAVDAITFTGSVPTGRKVASRAAERLIPASVELGGKDAAIVLADCDLERTALGIAQWGMHNAGQNCAAIERVYVEDAIADAFIPLLTRITQKLRIAQNPDDLSDLGPIQTPHQLELIQAQVQDALDKGATLLCGGQPQGPAWQPTLLDHCTHDMRIVTEETFGPVLAIIRVADADHAIQLANQSRYGLNGSVWTRDIRHGETLARKLDVGIALVNNHAFTGSLAALPWTGTKDTGPGIAASQWAYPTFTRPRTLFIDRNSQPDPWWIPADSNLQLFANALIQRSQGSLGATLQLPGLLRKRIQSIRSLAKE